MNIYVAGPWEMRQDVRKIAVVLRTSGFTVVSRWHDTTTYDNIAGTGADFKQYEPKDLREEAIEDLDDIRQADILLVLNAQKSEGKAVEQGYALAFHIPVLIVGAAPTNIFHYLAQVTIVPTLHAAMIHLNHAKHPVAAVARLA